MIRIGIDHAARIRPFVPLLADLIAPPVGERIELRPFRQSSDAEREAELALRNHDRLARYRKKRLALKMQQSMENMGSFARGL